MRNFRTLLTMFLSAAIAVMVFGSMNITSMAEETIELGEGNEINEGTYNADIYVNGGKISGGTFNGKISIGEGEISGGTFNGEISLGGGKISDGSFSGRLYGWGGEICGGTFNGDFEFVSGKISGGVFEVHKDNEIQISNAEITGGIFEEGSDNVSIQNSTITGGTFNGYNDIVDTVISNCTFGENSQLMLHGGSAISGGEFNGLINASEATISGGTFDGEVHMLSGTISGGVYNNTISNEGGRVTGGTYHSHLSAVGSSSSIDGITMDGGFLYILSYGGTPSVGNVTVKNRTEIFVDQGIDEEGLPSIEDALKNYFTPDSDASCLVMMTTSPRRAITVDAVREGKFNRVNITFDKNGGNGNVDDLWAYYYGMISFPDNTYTKEGTVFKEWNTKRDGSGVGCTAGGPIAYGYNVRYLGNYEDRDITLYAIWEDVSSESDDAPSDPRPDKEDDSTEKSITSVKLSTETASLLVGESLSLTASIEPSDATNKKIEWESSDTSVATVTDGIVTAVSAGKATITARAAAGGVSASCVVTVSSLVSSVILNSEKAYLNVGGDSLQLIATVEPSDAINEVTWISSNSGVATVSDSGVVSAISIGETTITATAINQEASASCIITVLAPGESAFTPGDKIVTPVEKKETVSASAVVAGTSINVSVDTKYNSAITFTGKKITPDMLGVEVDTSSITGAVVLKDDAAIKPADLVKVSYVNKNNINAGGENKAYFYGKIVINKSAKKALTNSEYKKLQKLVKAANTMLKDKNNTCKYTINPKSVTECQLEVHAKLKADGTIKVKNGKLTGLKSVKALISGLTKKLTTKMYQLTEPDAEAGTVKVSGKKNFTGTAVVKVAK